MHNYSMFLATEPEKYRAIAIIRAAGAVLTGVSGCGTGYYIQIDATQAQADEINQKLEAL